MDFATLIFFCNGKKIAEASPDPELPLAVYLRDSCTKVACGEGGCGACTVMLSSFSHVTGQIGHIAVNSCLVPLCAVHGMAVTTVEALGSTDTKLHPVQERIAKFHGSQCGFCTPGMIMSMYTLLRNNPQPSQEDIEAVLAGNLCRCTGYRPILQAFGTFSKDFQCPMGDKCCKKTQDGKKVQALTLGSVTLDMAQFDPTQDLIFPSELQLNGNLRSTVKFHGDRVVWATPDSLADLQHILTTTPNVTLIAGNTSLGVGNWYRPSTGKTTLVALHAIPELKQHHIDKSCVTLGSGLTLYDVSQILDKIIQQHPDHTVRGLKALHSIIQRFAGNQIRNVVTLGGNIANAGAISDINTVLCALGAIVLVLHADGSKRDIHLKDSYFLGDKKTALQNKDVILAIKIPFTKQNEYVYSFKQGKKRDNDIAIVNGCFKLALTETRTVGDITLAYGGVASQTVVASATAAKLINRPWNDDLIDIATKSLLQEIPVASGTPGGKEEYRRTLVPSLFYKFYLAVQIQLNNQDAAGFVELYPRTPCQGSQVISEVPEGQNATDAVGRPLQHLSADKQATGEARFLDDMPSFKDELHMSLVLSSRAHAKIVKIDASKALAMPGVVAFFCHEDVLPSQLCQADPNNPADKVFAHTEVTSDGQCVGAVVAQSSTLARRAAQAVAVHYEDLTPVITIQDAVDGKCLYAEERKLQAGDVTAAMRDADHVIEGQVHISGQEHFYMETQGCVAVPRGEDGAMEIFASAQYIAFVQTEVAKLLGVQANKITVRVKRIGGGFGGKETKPIITACAAALAAQKLKRPIRCILPRSDDMVATGARHSCRADYKVGCTKDGRITAVEYQIYSQGGHTIDVSPLLLELTMLNCDNAYKLDNFAVRGQVVRTNLPSNTSCRSAGSFQGVFFAENLLHHVAQELGLDPIHVRQINLHEEGDLTHYGQTMEGVNLQRCWTELMASASVTQRQEQVKAFNNENKWKKRGIAVVPMKYGIGFPYPFFNQGGVLLNVYLDGSVLMALGAVEMGQGVSTKMIQVASRALGIDKELIHTSDTSTDTVPNTISTGASVNSDIYGAAVVDACEKINKRLAPIKEKNPEGNWSQWVSAAFMERISLSATGFHGIPGLASLDWTTGKGIVYPYFMFGVGCSEVEIDCLTGAHTILRTDIVVDIGQSLNPAIDVGQIEGGFVMGLGMVTCEERLFTPEGRMVTRGPYTYKIPSCTDIPQQLNVSLLKGSSNPKAVYSSKGIGEPPMLMAQSVFFAIKEAIQAARVQNGLGPGHFRLDSPVTSESIRMQCGDAISQQSKKLTDTSKPPVTMRI